MENHLKTVVRTVISANKLNKIKTKSMIKYEAFLMNPTIGIMTQNFEEYSLNKTRLAKNRKREWTAIFLCIYAWSTVFKFFAASVISDPQTWQYIGDPFYLTGDRILFNLVIGSIALNAALMRTFFVIGEFV